MKAELPKRLIHVEWEAALGWPEPERRRRVRRNFTSASTAGEQIARIRALPSHLQLVSVHESCAIEWTPIENVDTLPIPETPRTEGDDDE